MRAACLVTIAAIKPQQVGLVNGLELGPGVADNDGIAIQPSICINHHQPNFATSSRNHRFLLNNFNVFQCLLVFVTGSDHDILHQFISYKSGPCRMLQGSDGPVKCSDKAASERKELEPRCTRKRLLNW